MSAAIALLMQMSLANPPPDLASFDLKDVARPAAADCTRATLQPNEILVCARRAAPPLDDGRYSQEALLPRAEIGVGGARLSVDAEQATLSRGETSQRAMVRLRIPF
ncbi:hypothetical protein GGR88_000832 [Sphingomonas jejuensis]|uniref:Uncharacterized protein n=1 Tax=Sphingomonas jejuensis TaxID=904715 RepID=A0ABX0XJ45_9SPHN|nr:hypothetical protein [Sphingomonas jejuensis]NJC33358.1 hypothetical protein [Sphingomonas jejuensis]